MNWKVLFYSRFSGIEGRTIFWTFVLINSLVFIAATIASYIAHDPLIIAAAQERFSSELKVGTCRDTARWQMIEGELVVFPDPQLSLPPIDRLEGFRPGHAGLYRRVLLPVFTAGGTIVIAWSYALGLRSVPGLRPIRLNEWSCPIDTNTS